MAIEYICKGCRHCRIDAPEVTEDGLCPHCLQKRDFPVKEPKKPYDKMTKSTEHWLIAMVLLLMAESTSETWIQWVLIAGAAPELWLAVFRWKHWPGSREQK